MAVVAALLLLFVARFASPLPPIATLDEVPHFYRELRDLLRRQAEEEENWPLTSVDSVREDVDWPSEEVQRTLGHTAGVSVDSSGLVHVFHRGDHVWNGSSFNANGIYQQKDLGPIAADAVLVLDPESGKLVRSWGSGKFYLPHGLHVDVKNNTWLTDIALHQVFKFAPGEYDKPALVLGEAFVPGDDLQHFCKPTAVVAASDGQFFVSDGYCNSRILMYDCSGNFLQLIGARGAADRMVVPHGLTLFEPHDLLCVADRENYRVLCYSAGRAGPAGFQRLSLHRPPMGRVFGIDHLGSYLFAVNGPDGWSAASGLPRPQGFIMDLRNDNLINHWGPKKGFIMPHDVSVAPDGSAVYVSEVGVDAPKRLYKFVPASPQLALVLG